MWKQNEAKVKVKVAQLCPTLCHPMDSTVHGIHQARILEWVAYPFSSGSSWPRNRTRVSCIAGGFFTNWGKVRSRIMDPQRCVCPETQNLSICYPTAVLVSGCYLATNSCLFVTPWTVALQTPLSMEFPRQEYWSGLPFPPLGYLPRPGIKLVSPALAGGFFTTESPGKPSMGCYNRIS